MLKIICYSSLATVVKLVMSLAIFFSYALQFYVPVDIINPYIQAYVQLFPSYFNLTQTFQLPVWPLKTPRHPTKAPSTQLLHKPPVPADVSVVRKQVREPEFTTKEVL